MQIKPKASEYNSYYATYVNLVSDGNIIQILAQQIEETNLLLKEISDSEGFFRYAPTKWSIKSNRPYCGYRTCYGVSLVIYRSRRDSRTSRL